MQRVTVRLDCQDSDVVHEYLVLNLPIDYDAQSLTLDDIVDDQQIQIVESFSFPGPAVSPNQ